MDKEQYRERVLKALEEIKLNTEMASVFTAITVILLFLIMTIVLFK